MTKLSVVLAYVPVIHTGYLELFRRTERFFGVLGGDILLELPYLKRDVRALRPRDAVSLLVTQSGWPRVDVEIIDTTNINQFKREISLRGGSSIFMPDEDVSRHVAENYLKGFEVEYLPAFLRWDMSRVKDCKVPSHHRTAGPETLPEGVLSLVREEAEKSPDWWRQIGVVCFREDEILLSSHNTHMPTDFSLHIDGDPRIVFDAGEEVERSRAAHAEGSVLIAEAARRGMPLDGASLLVTTFPCEPCAWSIARAGIKKLFYLEGYSRLDGDRVLSSWGVEIIHVHPAD